MFIFPLFLGMLMYAKEFKTKEKQKLMEIKNLLQHTHIYITITEAGSPVLGAMIYHKNNTILCDTSHQQKCHMV